MYSKHKFTALAFMAVLMSKAGGARNTGGGAAPKVATTEVKPAVTTVTTGDDSATSDDASSQNAGASQGTAGTTQETSLPRGLELEDVIDQTGVPGHDVNLIVDPQEDTPGAAGRELVPLKAPDGATSVVWQGETFTVAGGVIHVPAEAVSELGAHGFST